MCANSNGYPISDWLKGHANLDPDKERHIMRKNLHEDVRVVIVDSIPICVDLCATITDLTGIILRVVNNKTILRESQETLFAKKDAVSKENTKH